MKLTQVKGNTYVLEGWELIPLYKTDDTHCILLDSGLWNECGDVDAALAENHLTPVGVISTHIHPDHSANDRYFQEKYHLPIALSAGEADLCCDMESIRKYFHLPPGVTAPDFLDGMILDPEVKIAPEDHCTEVAGVSFEIVHTPGHSPDHISVITPDGVCYAGDALLSGRMLEAKVPFNHSHQDALDTYDLFPRLACDRYVLAHYGIYDDVTELAAANRQLILDRAERILSLVTHPMTKKEIIAAAFEHFAISSPDPVKQLILGHNVISYLPYLMERGDLEKLSDGSRRYQRTAQES